MNIRPELQLKREGYKFTKPPASYTLTIDQRREFCRFLKSVKFPDGYEANIARSANVDDGNISGLKSHDCHVLLQKVLPAGIRPFLPTDVCTALIELSNLFHDLCAKTLDVSHLEEMEKVGYSWMYPIERYLGTLKRYVNNKARPEGPIAEAYIINEALTFFSLYLRGIETKFNRPDRNDDTSDDGQRPKGKLSVFAQKVRPFGAKVKKSLTLEEREKIHWFILDNCDEVRPYMDEHLNELKAESNDNLPQRHRKLFPEWFRKRIGKLHYEKFPEATDELHSLAQGVESRAKSYPACIYYGV
ncbi:uncharacterized protein LOC113278498 [Papaver somniferum]|uniref:uncharacterized protein LOC113278498 n=1 Tax=Papaver somniferum TaxID=3469 RepID=UPI000E6FD65D|nr:uncharacterized protein LOC113278498 [Papaver somniferum]XP_026383105.1 uncharacterized protein LOC113278498 [Papaver somniferum]